MRIALIKETKNPVDNCVALTHQQVAALNKAYPGHQIVVQCSNIRSLIDDEYRTNGMEVLDGVRRFQSRR